MYARFIITMDEKAADVEWIQVLGMEGYQRENE